MCLFLPAIQSQVLILISCKSCYNVSINLFNVSIHQSKEIHFELEAWCTYLRQTTGRRLSETPQEYYHPRVVQLLQRQLYLKDALSQFENCIAYRPDPLQVKSSPTVIGNVCFTSVTSAILFLLNNICIVCSHSQS